MKKLVKFVPLVIILATLGGCYLSCGPIHIGNPCDSCTYTLTDSDLPNINIQLTPFIPPKALDTLSGWVRVDVTIGTIHFSTDDPRFKCFESLVPFIIADDFAFPGFYIAVYDNCFQSSYLRPASEAMMASLPLSNQVAVFKFPRNNSLCSQGRCILPPELTPTVVPTVVPTVAPPPSPTVQILSPKDGASYLFSDPLSGISLQLSSQASASVISYAWSDTLGLINDSNANDKLTIRPATSQTPCNTPVSDTITLTVSDSSRQTASASVTIQIERECIT